MFMLTNPDLIGWRTFAADAVLRGNDIVNPINTVWTLVAAFLVFGMQVGFTMLEAGFCRSRETVNVLMECIVDTCLCGILFYALGFAFMFSHGNGFIGLNWFFLKGAPATYEGDRRGVPGVLALPVCLCRHLLHHHLRRDDRPHRVRRRSALQLRVSGFIYPIIGHWAWGPDGFLATMGSAGNFLPWVGTSFHDFAGSTVVHTIGGFIALAGAIVLGPRLGRKFKRDGGGPMLPHDLTIAACGRSAPVVRLVWIQSRQHAFRHGLRGHRPGCGEHDAGGLRRRSDRDGCGLLHEQEMGRQLHGQWLPGRTRGDYVPVLLGRARGLHLARRHRRRDRGRRASNCSSTCGLMIRSARFRSTGCAGSGERFRWACSLAGNIGATGPFAADNSAPLKGLFYGGGTQVLVAQLIGSADRHGVRLLRWPMAVMYAVNAMGLLRVSREGETDGLDLHEHGISAYPEYVITATPRPAAMVTGTPVMSPQPTTRVATEPSH